MTGIMRSSSTTHGWSMCSSSASASAPLAAVTTSKPSSSRIHCTQSRMSGSSSTIITACPCGQPFVSSTLVTSTISTKRAPALRWLPDRALPEDQAGAGAAPSRGDRGPDLAVPLPDRLGILAGIELQAQLLGEVLGIAVLDKRVLFDHRLTSYAKERAADVPVETNYSRVEMRIESSSRSFDAGNSSSMPPEALTRPASIRIT